MRLSEFEKDCIITLAGHHFGTGVQVFLFGSRTNDQLRGGDIDLFIQNHDDKLLDARTKINFITDLIIQIGEQKIDVILNSPERKDTPFFKTISQTGIRLC